MQNQKIKKIQIIKVTKNTRSITLNSPELKKLHKSSHASLYSYSICNSNSINITKTKLNHRNRELKKKYQLVDRHEIRKDLSIAITSISRDIITRKCCLCFERRETERERDQERDGETRSETEGRRGGYKMSNIKERRRKVTVIIPLFFYRNYQKCPKKELERRRYKRVVIKFTEKKISKKLGGLDWIGYGFWGFFYII